jgi:IS30 family transposase
MNEEDEKRLREFRKEERKLRKQEERKKGKLHNPTVEERLDNLEHRWEVVKWVSIGMTINILITQIITFIVFRMMVN